MKKGSYKATIIFLVIGLPLVIWSASLNRPPTKQQSVINDTNHIQNIFEIQEKLKEQGFYKGKIDGKWGPLTDKAYCDWCATQEFKRYE